MKKKIIFGTIFIILLLGFVNALTESELNQISCSTFESGKSEIIGTEIPEQIPYSNEIFNIYIGDEIFGNIVIIESIISDISCTENENRTYDIYIKDYSVLTSFGETDDTFGMFQEKLKNKEIEIKGVSFGKKTKMFFTKIGLKIAGWFM
jgi:hypothetical protein